MDSGCAMFRMFPALLEESGTRAWGTDRDRRSLVDRGGWSRKGPQMRDDAGPSGADASFRVMSGVLILRSAPVTRFSDRAHVRCVLLASW